MAEEIDIKYKKPKIIIIDLPESIADCLKSNGFNVIRGTLGTPYEVQQSDNLLPVGLNHSLPNITEQEIVCIDLASPRTIGKYNPPSITPGTKSWYGKCDLGKIDPRPIVAFNIRDIMERIFENKGIFIIFSSFDFDQEFHFGNHSDFEDYHKNTEIKVSLWSFLSILSNLGKEFSDGKEILATKGIEIFPFLREYTNDSYFDTIIRVYGDFSTSWIPLFENKYGDCIGGVIATKDKGLVIVLPQLVDKGEIILRLLKESLPEYRPDLFPEIETGRWLKRDEYEFVEVKQLKSEVESIKEDAEKKIALLENEILQIRQKFDYMHGIITKTGTPLVIDIETGLKSIFHEIINVDEEIPNDKDLQEDLQIRDRPTTILVEIKGLTRFPDESNIAQLVKFMLRRTRELRSNIRGCFIVNHQRHLPPLERNNDTVFTEAQISDSVNNEITLLSSWQLFKLLDGMEKWHWDRRKVQEIFYQNGRFSGVPPFYELLGNIVNYYEKVNVLGIEITDGSLKSGDKIAYITERGYLEENVDSMQIDNQAVSEAKLAQGVGIKTKYGKDSLKGASQVYLVRN